MHAHYYLVAGAESIVSAGTKMENLVSRKRWTDPHFDLVCSDINSTDMMISDLNW